MPLAADLLLDSLYTDDSVVLNNDPAPSFNCTSDGPDCLPEEPLRPWVLYLHTSSEPWRCAAVVPSLGA